MSRSLASTRTLATNRTLSSDRTGDLGITKALHLNSPDSQYVDFGAQTFLDGTPFTLGLRIWTTRSDMAHDGTLWSYGWINSGVGASGYLFRLDGSTRRMQFWWGSQNTTINNIRVVGKQYIFLEFDGATTSRVYNGTALTDTFTTAARTSSGSSTFMGCRDALGRFFCGVVGDGAIYNRVLTAAEKRQIVKLAEYPTSGLQLMVKNNEGTGTTITDYSGNNRNGTLQVGTATAMWRNSPFNA